MQPFLQELCDAIRHGDEVLGSNWKQREYWANVEKVIQVSLGENINNPLSYHNMCRK